ncbi:MAG TPA: hypothetical protein VKV02_10710 [Acidobacteriaceae bacterium]|nr:hypothetical protein [Acidobacteriaceae bacterium]
MRLPHLLATLLVIALSPAVRAQSNEANIAGFGPLDPAKPTAHTIDEIIQRMGEQESRFEHARDQYIFRQIIKMDTIDDDTGKADGEWQEVSDVSFDNAGKRVEHVVFAPANTIQKVIINENDVNDIKYRLPFILTSAQLPDYNVNYLGRQKVDDLDTYVFDITPKQIVKGHRYFQGKVWVDQQDLEIVMCNGLNVPQDTRRGHEDLSPPFTTYYQQIDGKYWFPTYTRAEGVLHFPGANGYLAQDVHMRATVRYTDYKQFHTSVTIKYNGQDIPSESDKPQTDKQPVTKPQP